MPTVLGTSFATGGFSYDPNLSPNNQSFSSAVLAVMARLGYPAGGIGGTGLPAAAFANPTVKVALTATNGTSSRAMRADAAPALDQSISPTWTGTHVFQVITLFGTATAYGWGGGPTLSPVLQFAGVGGVMPQDGAIVNIAAGGYFDGTVWRYTGTGAANAGTSTIGRLSLGGVTPFQIQVGTGGTNGQSASLVQVLTVDGTQMKFRGPVAAALVDATADASSFTGTLAGVNASVTGAVTWARYGNLVVMNLPGGLAGTSTTTTCSITGPIPASIQPARTQTVPIAAGAFEDNSAGVNTVQVLVGAGTVITFRLNGNPNGFTATGQKGVLSSTTIAYLTN